MRILITGGCGFLGTNLAACGADSGHEVIVLDNLSRAGSKVNLDWLRSRWSIDLEKVDVRDASEMVRVIIQSQPGAVFHLAAQVAMTSSIADPKADFEVNAVGTYNLLEAIRLHAPECVLLFASTNKVYGDLEQFSYRETALRFKCVDRPQGFAEDTPLSFRTPYGCSKGAADQYVQDYARTYGLNTIVLRHSSIYGGRQFATRDQGWVTWFCQEALARASERNTQPIAISGNGKQVRDLLHVDDAVRLYFGALEDYRSAVGEAFNVGGGIENSLSLLELMALLEELVGTRLQVQSHPPRMSDQRVFVADIRKAKETFQWQPTIGVREGIGRTLSWAREALAAG
jgi:CDP-paratose 2-epimerase